MSCVSIWIAKRKIKVQFGNSRATITDFQLALCMEDGRPQKVNSNNVESYTKKHKRKRVPVEESAGIVATEEEVKPERKKRRTDKKSANVFIV